MYEIYCKLRDSKGMKDSDVAKATGITKSTFSDWENGRSNPKDAKLQKIADLFGVTAEYIRTGKNSNEYYTNTETAQVAQEIFEELEYDESLGVRLLGVTVTEFGAQKATLDMQQLETG